MKIPRTTIYNIIQRYKNDPTTLENRPKTGRPQNPEDNAPAHKSAETSTWFLENGVDVLENWPPNSPDLNIIENLWSILKGRVAKRHPKTLEDLETFALEEFHAIPDEYVQKLFKSMKNWLILTKINRGGFTLL